MVLDDDTLNARPTAGLDEPFGRGQVLLFPHDPHLRGLARRTERLRWNGVFDP
jgi:hypothetical protein